jgi:hypothetical protein
VLTVGAGGCREAALDGLVEVLGVLRARQTMKKIRVHH